MGICLNRFLFSRDLSSFCILPLHLLFLYPLSPVLSCRVTRVSLAFSYFFAFYSYRHNHHHGYTHAHPIFHYSDFRVSQIFNCIVSSIVSSVPQPMASQTLRSSSEHRLGIRPQFSLRVCWWVRCEGHDRIGLHNRNLTGT